MVEGTGKIPFREESDGDDKNDSFNSVSGVFCPGMSFFTPELIPKGLPA
jgi:hypothetical protein